MHNSNWFRSALIALTAVAGLLSVVAGTARAAVKGTWSIEARVAIPEKEIASRGAARAKAEMVDSIVAAMEAKGVEVEVREVAGRGEEAAYALKVTSSGTVDDFRRQFHTAVMPELVKLGGAAEMRISSFAQSQISDVVIAANPSTGYLWTVAGDSEFQESAPADFIMHTRGYGVPQHQVLHLRNDSQRAGAIRMVYHRPWETAATTVSIALNLDSLPQRLDLSDPTVPSGPVTPPAAGRINAAFPSLKAESLPSSFDWRTQGIVTPVRDQGACGSCWAFGTVGVMESALWKSGTAGNADLSEQFLVSCNQSGWSCRGGLTAHRYHYDTLGKNQIDIGAVLESDKPYTATNGTCDTPLSHPYRLSGWQFIVPSEFDMPTVDQIKSAIYTYGPITAGVCAGSAWSGYSGGIFMTNETCTYGTNHQIILVGWDDNGGTDGYWILRNSWGTGWGESGYMKIKYGTSRVGEGTSWVTIAPPAEASITVTSPNGGETMYTGAVVPIRWSYTGNPGANVKIELYNGATLSRTISSSTPLASGVYNWTIPSTQTLGSNYKIKITSTTNSTVSDSSDAPFTIANPSITVTSPNGGETLFRSAVVPIRWSYTGNPGANVKIQLYNGSTLSRTITSSTSLTSGTYYWTIPSTQTLGSNYKIKITSTTNSAFSDTSNAPFTIARPSITVTSPNGGESFIRGTVMPITWTYAGNPGANVKILLYKGLFLSRTITTGTPLSAGRYNWTIPSTQSTGTTYKIKIVSTTSSSYSDSSNAYFTIK